MQSRDPASKCAKLAGYDDPVKIHLRQGLLTDYDRLRLIYDNLFPNIFKNFEQILSKISAKKFKYVLSSISSHVSLF